LNINKLLCKCNSVSNTSCKLRFNNIVLVYSSYTYVTLRREDFLEKLLVHVRRDEKAESSPLLKVNRPKSVRLFVIRGSDRFPDHIFEICTRIT